MKQTDIEKVVLDYIDYREKDDRFTSFDYCYNYFLKTDDLTKDIEKSCLVLGFYLASWGMYRGSSFLLKRSVNHLRPTIEYINNLDDSYWKIDVDKYTDENIDKIIKVYEDISKILVPKENADLTLVTKVLLGVFGFVPAYDSLFCNTFRGIFKDSCGFRSFNKNSLKCIYEFYEANKEALDNLSIITNTIDFTSGYTTKYKYPIAKIIDMYGFNRLSASQTQTVLEIGADGGDICIKRKKTKLGNIFIYKHDESDLSNEGLYVNFSNEYSDFQTAFELMKNKYAWYGLHLISVHQDYHKDISKSLVCDLNKNSIKEFHSKENFEDTLNINLIAKIDKNNNYKWSYKNR